MRTELPLVSPTPRELASSRTRPGWLRGRRGACPGCRSISAGVGGDTKGHVEIGGTGRQVTLGQKTLYPRGTQLSFLLLGPTGVQAGAEDGHRGRTARRGSPLESRLQGGSAPDAFSPPWAIQVCAQPGAVGSPL